MESLIAVILPSNFLQDFPVTTNRFTSTKETAYTAFRQREPLFLFAFVDVSQIYLNQQHIY